jgi:NadR type nicotinamide-nucleotide adenylyltransferase
VTARYGHGLVLGKFYPLHAGHGALIRRATMDCGRVTVQVLASEVESVSLQTRMGWLREEHPTVTVVGGYDEAEVDYGSPAAWDAHMRVISALLDAPVDAVFTGDDYGAELARRLDAEWVRADRAETPVSGRAVRADVAGHWHLLPAAVRRALTPRVVVLGAESTGTSTLAADLAEALGTVWVPEYGREYTEIRAGGLHAPWRDDEFELIVDRQLAAEAAAARRAPRPLLVCDTDVLATAVWFERYRGRWPAALHRRALDHPPLLYLLTGDEIPFVADGMRDGEHIRPEMARRFREVLAGQPVPWTELRGDRRHRLAAAVRAVEARLPEAFRFADPLEMRADSPLPRR